MIYQIVANDIFDHAELLHLQFVLPDSKKTADTCKSNTLKVSVKSALSTDESLVYSATTTNCITHIYISEDLLNMNADIIWEWSQDGAVFSSGTKKVTGNIIADGLTTEGFVITDSWLNSGYLTAGEVAAIVVGSVVFAFLLVLLVVCLCYNCRYRAVPTMYQM